MDYSILSPQIMDFVGIWTMLMLMINVWSISESGKRKKIAGVIIGAGAFVISFILFEMEILSCHLAGYGKAASAELAKMIPSRELSLFLFITASLISIATLCRHMYERHHIVSERSISYFVDSMPVGICYYSENGRILLTNACMKRICYEYTGRALLNAFDFTKNASDDYITLKDHTIWKIDRNHKEYEDGTIYEIICSDISELVEKRLSLEEKNKAVEALRDKLRSYQLDIDELIKKKEILKAKMDIHDDMNSLMLLTVAAIDAGDDHMLKEAMNKWSRNALLATKEIRRSENEFKNVTDLAAMLGITILGEECVRLVPEDYLDLYCVIAREALINVSKHSNATVLHINVENRRGLRFIFDNDRILPTNTGTAGMTGGLDSIKRLITERRGTITAGYQDDRFVLEVYFEGN